MNCQEFQENLYEHLDGILEQTVETAAREHLDACASCRQALLKERARTEQLHQALENAAGRVSLPVSTRADIVRAAASAMHASAAPWTLWRAFIASLFRPVGALAATLLVLFAVTGIQLHRRGAVTPSPPIHRNAISTRVIDVPIQTETYFFQRNNQEVVDTMLPSVAVGHARIPNNELK